MLDGMIRGKDDGGACAASGSRKARSRCGHDVPLMRLIAAFTGKHVPPLSKFGEVHG